MKRRTNSPGLSELQISNSKLQGSFKLQDSSGLSKLLAKSATFWSALKGIFKLQTPNFMETPGFKLQMGLRDSARFWSACRAEAMRRSAAVLCRFVGAAQNLQAFKLSHVGTWIFLLILIDFLFTAQTASATWKAGLAKQNITPENGLWLAGYGMRDKPAEGKVMELWIKALALEDAGSNRAVIVTTDTLGIPQTIYLHTLGELKAKLGLNPEQIILSASHTHCGPVLRQSLYDAYPLTDEQRGLIEKYSQQFEAKLVQAVSDAFAALSPAEMTAIEEQTNFAVNRRNNSEGKVPELLREGALKGPIDHSVPVLAVNDPKGKLIAVMFGYACHNTVMSFYKWSGDYAGFAQLALEKSHPGAQAMFFMGCGGDQNPLPRGRLELAERYGNMLASAVEQALREKPRALSPRLTTTMEMVKLDFGPELTKSELVALKNGTNASPRRWATHILADMDAGKVIPRSYPYPVQAWSMGGQLLVTMGGEPVVDYSLKFKQAFGPQTWVAGYCNDVMTYIPSLRVLKEGGYEGGKAMIPYGLPALRWADDVEDRITSSVERLIEKVRHQQQEK